MITRFLVILSVSISVPIAWFHRIAEAGNCRLVFQDEPYFAINNKNMSGILGEISKLIQITDDVTQVDDLPLIELSQCQRHPVDDHPYYNFFIISWSIGKRFKSANKPSL